MKTATAVPNVVTTIELARIKEERKKLALLRGQAETLARSLDDREQEVIARIEGGAWVDGPAEVVDRRRQNISWLTIVKRELGEEAVIRVKDSWPVTFYKTLQIP